MRAGWLDMRNSHKYSDRFSQAMIHFMCLRFCWILLQTSYKTAVLNVNTLTALLRLKIIGRKSSILVFSSPEPKAPGELIGWEGSVVRRPSSVRRPSVHNFKRLLL